MKDALDFTFTAAELFAAFRLAMSESEAHAKAAEVAEAMQGGERDWATSEHVLLLLAIGSASGNEQVERIRRAVQEARFDLWRNDNAAPGVGDDELQRRWTQMVASENRAWAARRSELERSLRQQGRFPPEG